MSILCCYCRHTCDFVLNQLGLHTSGWNDQIAIEIINAVYLSLQCQGKVRTLLAKEVNLQNEFIRLQEE